MLTLAILVNGCGAGRENASTPLNVVLITLDTTRADHLGIAGHARAKTPHLDRLAREGAWFARAYSSVPLTLPAHASLLTGTYPPDHGVRDNFGAALAPQALTLAEALAHTGRSSFAVLGAAVLDAHTGLGQGFDTYEDLGGVGALAVVASERTAREVVDRAIAHWEALGDRPVFAWLHFYDPHLPYAPPSPYREAFAADSYSGELAYVDAELGRFLAHLDRKGALQHSLVVVAGDHGEGLGEHGEDDHGVFLYDATLHVPLIVWAPRVVKRGLVVQTTVRDVDVMPTLLELAGVASPPALRGNSLVPLLRGASESARPAYAESDYAHRHYGWAPLRALRDDRYKYIDAPRPELFDLRRDPRERANLAHDLPAKVEAFRATLERDYRPSSTPRPSPDASAPDAAATERMRTLGYAAASVRSPATVPSSLPDPKDRLDALALLSKAGRAALASIEADPQAALAELERALAAEPRYADGHVLRANALERLGRMAEAAQALEEALRLDSLSAETHFDLARVRAAAGDLERALASLATANRLRPDDTRFALAEVHIHQARGHAGKAETVLRRVLAQAPQNVEAHLRLAELLAATRGRLAESRQHAQTALRLSPDLVAARELLDRLARHTAAPGT